MIVGITGGSGCGKSTALKAISALGGTVLDCDAIYHRLLETDIALLEAIEKSFPGTVTENRLDRKALGAIVFSDPAALQDLNAITHAAVKKEVLRLLPGNGLAAIEAIGLFEGGLSELCHITVAITAPEEMRIARLMARENISAEYAKLRLSAQRSQEEFISLCTHHLENNGTEEEFLQKCLVFFGNPDIIKENA
ncbi:MAG: dephospho-CoA kinase [Oscillospiraceae bacterium]|nr:dephospho-CoA kinase [Oscillospiraceae bacterium]